MLTARDMQRINDDVADIISDWAIMVDLKTPAPPDRQPGWNPILREVSGSMVYDTLTNVPAERKDIDSDTLDTTQGGDRFSGSVLLHLPLSYLVGGVVTNITVHDDTLVIMDGNTSEPWRIKNRFSRAGETILQIIKKVGG